MCLVQVCKNLNFGTHVRFRRAQERQGPEFSETLFAIHRYVSQCGTACDFEMVDIGESFQVTCAEIWEIAENESRERFSSVYNPQT